jgi:hypothetical protein
VRYQPVGNRSKSGSRIENDACGFVIKLSGVRISKDDAIGLCPSMRAPRDYLFNLGSFAVGPFVDQVGQVVVRAEGLESVCTEEKKGRMVMGLGHFLGE